MSRNDITDLLIRWRSGDEAAKNHLFNLIYPELKRLSHKQLKQGDRRYLQTTELVHEAYIKLLGQQKLGENRGHFFKLVSMIMRRITIDMARKNHKDAELVDGEIDTMFVVKLGKRSVNIIDVDRVLTELAEVEPRLAQVVEMRFFGGFQYEDIATALNFSEITVKRDWQKAKAWLASRLNRDLAMDDT